MRFKQATAAAMVGALALGAMNAQAQPTGAQVPSLALVGLNVADLERSMAFYTKVVGMKEVRRYTFPEITEVLLNYSGSNADPFIVLVWRKANKGPYQHGTGFSRVGVRVPDAKAVIERSRAAGYKVERDVIQMPDGGAVLGFIKDPDGYSIELIQER